MRKLPISTIIHRLDKNNSFKINMEKNNAIYKFELIIDGFSFNGESNKNFVDAAFETMQDLSNRKEIKEKIYLSESDEYDFDKYINEIEEKNES